MPKDHIHFKVAEDTAALLTDTAFAPLLKGHTPGLLLGSVFHDALFYAVAGSSRHLAPLADRLHGADGEDTYALLRLQARHVREANNPAMAASLMVGMVSHLFADVVMHPLIWHLSGNYYADDPNEKSLARQHHRALETLMDMTFCPEMIGRPLYSLPRLLRSAGKELYTALPMDALAELAGTSAHKVTSGLKTAWRIQAGFQAAYSIKPLAAALHALMPVLPRAGREIAVLFYAPRLMAQADGLRGEVDYRDPVTGEHLSATIPAMMGTAASRAAALCRELEPVLGGGTVDLSGRGPSMDAGIPDTPTTAMRYFANASFPQLS